MLSSVETCKFILHIGNFSQYKSSKQTYKGTEGDTAVVDRVALCTDKNSNLCIKYMIRSTRRPEVVKKIWIDDFLNLKLSSIFTK